MTPFKIRLAIEKIQRGELIAYPTEAIYGLGCNPLNEEAVFNLLKLKNRPVEKGLILIASSISQLEAYLQLTPAIIEKIQPIKNKPMTWIVPAQSSVPNWLTGKHNSLAVRITQHPIARALCEQNEAPIVSTSANISTKPPASKAWQVHQRLANQNIFVVGGAVGKLKQATPIYNVLTQDKIR